MARVLLAAAFVASVGCASSPDRGAAPDLVPTAIETPAVIEWDGHARLQPVFRPEHYDLRLTIDPRQTTFSGAVSIQGNLAKETVAIKLHGEELRVSSAQVVRDGKRVLLTPYSGQNGALTLIAPEPLKAGDVVLELEWEADLPETPVGMYRVKDNDEWYAFTQFEPLEARRVFPCLDQPDGKATFKTTMIVPDSMTPLTNTPVDFKAVTPATPALEGDVVGMRTVTFEKTRPIPSYLVAFAVGEFDIVSAAKGASPVPLRIVTTKGKGKLAKFALEKTPAILKALVDYFGSPYPYRKLDMVAVPNFSSGAMENVGLVTYREPLLLLDGTTATVSQRTRSETIIAHELAHMWFGNLVTLEWWNDLWLNEAFATWMSYKVIEQVAPELGIGTRILNSKSWVMGADAQASTRAIRQPILTGGDIYNAFDGITYTKGQNVLHMVERWLGPEVFQEGVRAYLEANTDDNAVTDDLMGALAAASNKPVRKVFRRFLDQPGTPLVSVEVTCAGKHSPATLKLAQTRYQKTGGTAPAGEPWTLPVCVRYGVDRGQAVSECVLLDGPSLEHTLKTPGCPAWLAPNDDEGGYYRWSLDAKSLAALTGKYRKHLTEREQVAMPGHLSALFAANALSAADYLDALTAIIAGDPPFPVLQSAISGLMGVRRLGLDEAQLAQLNAMVSDVVGPRASKGLTMTADMSLETRKRRPVLIAALGAAEAPEATKLARQTAEQFIASFEDGAAAKAPSPDMLSAYLPIATRMDAKHWGGAKAKAALWEQLRAVLPQTRDPNERATVIGALGAFTEPDLLLRSLDLTLRPELLAQDFGTLARRVGQTEITQQTAWAWLTKSFDAVVAKIGAKAAPRLPRVAARFCTEEDAKAVSVFFGEKRASIPAGLDRRLAQTLEAIRECATLRSVHLDGVAEYLGKRRWRSALRQR